MKLYELQLDNSKNHSPFVLRVLAVIDKLYAKKKLSMEPGDKDALTQSLLSAMKKRGETVDVVVDAAVKIIDKRMHSTKTSQQAGRYIDLSRVRDAVQQAFKHALTENQEHDLFYKGYAIDFDQDSDGFFWINYNPELPKELDLKYNKGLNRSNAEIVAKRAVDELKNKVNEESNWVKTREGLFKNLHTGVLSSKPSNEGEPSNKEKLEYYKKKLADLKAKPNTPKSHIEQAEKMIRRYSK